MTACLAPPNPCGQALVQWCEQLVLEPVPSRPVAVAYSAGADSTALLLAACQRWPGAVVALHVHHGLQAAADLFEAHGRDFCEQHGVDFKVRRIDATHAPGQSPEDAARTGRYRTLASMAQQAGAVCVLLGQHADDQAETLLLALSRGAGLPGLASMPAGFERYGVRFGRPILSVTAAALRQWLRASGHAFVEDPSNADTRFTRNRIRSILLPAWEACFPGFRPMLARSARHAAQAQALLDDLAAMDIRHTGAPPVIDRLQGFSRERQANLVRYWLRQQAGVVASTAQMDELLDQLSDCTTRGHSIRLKVASGWVSREGDRLTYTPPI